MYESIEVYSPVTATVMFYMNWQRILEYTQKFDFRMFFRAKSNKFSIKASFFTIQNFLLKKG